MPTEAKMKTKVKAILNPDVNNTSQAYWERVLKSHDLNVVEEEIVEFSDTAWLDYASLEFIDERTSE